jgi:hypothetical protein
VLSAKLLEVTPVDPVVLRRRVIAGKAIYAASPEQTARVATNPTALKTSTANYTTTPAIQTVQPSQTRSNVFDVSRFSSAALAEASRNLSLPVVEVPQSAQSGDYVQDNGALYLQAQIMLAAWGKRYPGACDPANFGSSEQDFSARNDPRTVRAITSFQRWVNAHGAHVSTDGQLDSPTYALLTQAASGALPPQTSSAPAKNKWPLAALAVGAAYAAYSLLGED